jgi:hypothetical protein
LRERHSSSEDTFRLRPEREQARERENVPAFQVYRTARVRAKSIYFSLFEHGKGH